MTKPFLMVVTSHDTLGTSGNKTGSWLEELATPYWRFTEAGLDVRLASPKGGPAPLDPLSLQDPWISDAGRRFLEDAEAQRKLTSTQPLQDVDGADLLGLFLVGGTATTWDFPHDRSIRRLAEQLHARSAVVAGICHGVIGLIQAVDAHGEPLVKNRRVTSISKAEDVLMGVDRIVPVLPEDMLRKLRALYSAAPPLAEHVVCDPPFFTGQNPASADLLARKIIEHLRHTGALDAAPPA